MLKINVNNVKKVLESQMMVNVQNALLSAFIVLRMPYNAPCVPMDLVSLMIENVSYVQYSSAKNVQQII